MLSGSTSHEKMSQTESRYHDVKSAKTLDKRPSQGSVRLKAKLAGFSGATGSSFQE